MIFRVLILIALMSAFIEGLSGNKNNLHAADSLFKSQKYTEAFELYESIYNDGLESPAMLIKMAFIKEGLGNYTEALFFLDRYYKKTADKKVLNKMQELADQKDLSGYELSDYKFLVNNLNRYSTMILFVLFSLCLLILLGIYIKKVKGARALPWVTGQVLLLIIGLVIINRLYSEPEAIIKSNQTVLMDGPSAGAEAIDLIGKGHKVIVLSKGEVWTKIKIEDKEVYVRSNRLIKLF